MGDAVTAGVPGASGASLSDEEFRALVGRYADRVEAALETCLPPASSAPSDLHGAMRYSVLGGGKRLRALLVYCAGRICGADDDVLDAPACAVELLHAYSLIHDDLPAMDDDDLRRGKPSCHKAFGEAIAILAGDALQSLAFRVVASPLAEDADNTLARQRLELVECFAQASGSLGMAGGQALDLAAEGAELTLAELENVHVHKTGALIRASVTMGALCAPGVERGALVQLDDYARSVGLAFQIRDDILDIEGDTETLGKPQGSDQDLEKSTYPSLLGLDASKALALEFHERAVAALEPFGASAAPLRALSEFAVTRQS